MTRIKHELTRQLRHCPACDGDQDCLLYESFVRGHGLAHWRRYDVRQRWECLRCGTKTTVRLEPAGGSPG